MQKCITISRQSLSKIKECLVEKELKNPPKGLILWMLNQYENFTTTYAAILMNFTTNMYHNKVFHLVKSWA